MAADGTLTPPTGVDDTAWQTKPLFDHTFTWPYSRVTRLHLTTGPQASVCLCEIPTSSGADHSAPEVSATNALSGIRIGTPAEARLVYNSAETIIFTGKVREIQHDLKRDVVAVEIADARWPLASFRTRGSYWATDSGITYRQAWKSWINPHGTPNALWVGQYPFFCTPWYGCSTTVAPAASASKSTTTACYWTPWMVLMHLQYIYTNQSVSQGITFVQDWAAMTQPAGTSERHAKERILDGHSFTELLQEVLHEAGDFTYAIDGQSTVGSDGSVTYTPQLVCLKSRYEGGGAQLAATGITLERASAGNAKDTISINQDQAIIDGGLRESGKNLHTTFSVAGQPIFIEQRIDSKTGGIGGLIKAWSSTDQTAWLNIVKADATGTATGIKSANAAYPNVFCAYRLDPTYNFLANASYTLPDGTQLSAATRAQVPRQLLGHLLTSVLENTAQASSADNTRYSVPIQAEYHDGTNWNLGNFNDGLQMSGDGLLWFPGLRDASPAQTYSVSGAHGAETVTVYDLRLTVAVPTDLRLTVTQGVLNESGAPIVSQDDLDRIDTTNLTIEYRADASEPYRLLVRNGGGADSDTNASSYPRPAKAGGTPATAVTIVDDTSALKEHVTSRQRDMGRLDRGGTLILPYPSVLGLGCAIKSLQNSNGTEYPVRAVVTGLTIEFGKRQQSTTLELS